MKVLKELVQHHVDEEEGHVFPKAEAHDLDWDSLYEKARMLKNQGLKKEHSGGRPSNLHRQRAA